MDTDFQNMLNFFNAVFEEIPDFLMSKPIFYFVAILIGYFAVGIIILLLHQRRK